MAMLVEDLNIRKQKIIFWNWNHSAEVVCRSVDAKLSKYFSYKENLECLLQGGRQHIVTKVFYENKPSSFA
jgi:hypothetical protein